MDYKKISAFILRERKAKNLTQEQLSEKLCVSPKTVYKWENGNGLPDTELLLPICDIFGITLNELLSGERLSTEKCREQADSNLMSVLHENERKSKMHSKIMNWVVAITVVLPCVLTNILEKSNCKLQFIGRYKIHFRLLLHRQQITPNRPRQSGSHKKLFANFVCHSLL